MHSHRLEPVYLLVDLDFAGQTVEGTWTATATDTSGLAMGTLGVPVAADAPTCELLLSIPTISDADE